MASSFPITQFRLSQITSSGQRSEFAPKTGRMRTVIRADIIPWISNNSRSNISANYDVRDTIQPAVCTILAPSSKKYTQCLMFLRGTQHRQHASQTIPLGNCCKLRRTTRPQRGDESVVEQRSLTRATTAGEIISLGVVRVSHASVGLVPPISASSSGRVGHTVIANGDR